MSFLLILLYVFSKGFFRIKSYATIVGQILMLVAVPEGIIETHFSRVCYAHSWVS
jgi:hypothetical protein